MSSNFVSNYDLHYRRMLNEVPDWDAAEREPQRFALKTPWLPKEKEARILDLGCGWGRLLMGLWAAGYKNIEGIEISPEQHAVAVKAAGNRVPIILADALEYLRDREALYDVVIIYDVLEHINTATALALLKLVHASLKDGGKVVIRVPNASSLLATYSRYLDITHERAYTEYSLMQLLDLAGFVDHQVVPDDTSYKREIWRWWRPWRGLSLMPKANRILHRILYMLRGQSPIPTVFGYNVEVFSTKRQVHMQR